MCTSYFLDVSRQQESWLPLLQEAERRLKAITGNSINLKASSRSRPWFSGNFSGFKYSGRQSNEGCRKRSCLRAPSTEEQRCGSTTTPASRQRRSRASSSPPPAVMIGRFGWPSTSTALRPLRASTSRTMPSRNLPRNELKYPDQRRSRRCCLTNQVTETSPSQASTSLSGFNKSFVVYTATWDTRPRRCFKCRASRRSSFAV